MNRRIITAIMSMAYILLTVVATSPVYADINATTTQAISAGISYLANNQNSDGSISGYGGETDWAVEAVVLAGQNPTQFMHNGSASIIDNLKTDILTNTTAATSIERRILAINAAGLDSTNFGGINYNSLLASQFNAGQIGDPTLLNDDIFGILAIAASHDSSLKPEAQDALNYLLAHQGSDGGFSYTTASCAYCGSDNNDTAAAIMALYAANLMGLSSNTLAASKESALTYLLNTQQPDGGFAYDTSSPSDGSSTAWSLMVLNTVGASVNAQAALASSWLLKDQNADGGFSYGAYGTTTSDTYTTDNAIIALAGSSWTLSPSPSTVPTVPPTLPTPQTPSPTTVNSSPSVQTVTTTSVNTSSVTPNGANTSNDTTGSSDSSQNNNLNIANTASSILGNPHQKIASTSSSSHKNYRYEAISLILLIVVGLAWFMIESRQARKVKNDV